MKTTASCSQSLFLRIVLIQFSLLASLWGMGQSPLPVRNLTTSDGLPSNRIKAILEDDLGNLWIGTDAGLVKYDGADFYPIVIKEGLSLNRTNISCLFYDSQKNIWVGTVEFGLFSINTYTGKTQVFYHDTNDSNSLPDNRITCILEDKQGQMWFGVHRKGVCKLDPVSGKFQNFQPGRHFPELPGRDVNVLLSMANDPATGDRLWLGTLRGLFLLDPMSEKMEYFPLLKKHFPPQKKWTGFENLILAIHPDTNGSLYLGTWGGGLCKLNPATNDCRHFNFETVLPIRQFRNVVSDIHSAPDGKLWLATSSKKGGIAKFDPVNGHFFFPFAAQKSMDACKANQIFIDSEQNQWIGSRKGLFLNLSQKNPFQFEAGASVEKVFPHPDGKRLFIALRKKAKIEVRDKKGSLLKSYHFVPLLNKGPGLNSIHNIFFTPKGKVLALENTDLYYLDETLDSLVLIYKFEVDAIRKNLWGFVSSEMDEHGNIWLGNKYAGLFRLDGESHELTQFTHDPKDPKSLVHTAWIFDLLEDREGNIWIGTEEGWGYWDPNTTSFVNFPYNSLRSGELGVQLKEISAIAEDPSGRIWVGSPNRGLANLIQNTSPQETLPIFTTKNGLRDDAIWDMICGPKGFLWMTTRAGLSQLNTKSMEIRNFGGEYGLKKLDKLSCAKDGTIYLGATNGYYYFPEDALSQPRQPLKVLLRSFKVGDKDYEGKLALNYLKSVSLPHFQNFLSFEYAALNFFDPGFVEYSYRIKGVDQDWVFAEKRKFCNYTNLKPGHHVFEVRARSEGQKWGKPSQLLIKIAVPIWQTWWFTTLWILTIAGMVYGVVRWRIGQIQSQAEARHVFDEKLRELEKKALQAQMNPHFLFNCLNSIKLLILKSEKKKAAFHLTQFSKLIRLILQNSEQNLVNLAEELKALELYIGLEQLRLNDQFGYELKIDSQIDPSNLQYPPLILQPMVENAIWHGLSSKKEAGLLKITLRKVGTDLEILIEDNGIGRKAAHGLRRKTSPKDKSFGIEITRERLQLGFLQGKYHRTGKLEIEDLENKAGKPNGTRIRIISPLPGNQK